MHRTLELIHIKLIIERPYLTDMLFFMHIYTPIIPYKWKFLPGEIFFREFFCTVKF